jgi:hypothetical protein
MDEEIHQALEKEREKSDNTYANKMVEKIVYGGLTVVSLAVLYKLLETINLK